MLGQLLVVYFLIDHRIVLLRRGSAVLVVTNSAG